MFKYFVVVFLVWCQCREYASAHYEGDTSETLGKDIFEEHESSQGNKTFVLLSQNSSTTIPQLNSSESEGEIRYQPEVGRQVFYVLGEQELKRLLSDVRRNDNTNNNTLPQGYVVTPRIGAHKLHLRSMSWAKARQACIREGGHLAIINFESEEELLLQMLQEKNIVSAWVGFFFKDGDWYTVNGESLESAGYTKWITAYSDQPNCGILRKQHGVHDGPCVFTRSFFCEIPV